MTDAEYEAQLARLRALEAKWDAPLGMRWWKVTDVYYREGLPIAEHDPAELAENWQPIARSRIKWAYRQLHVRWDMPMVADLTDDELESSFVHERVHALVNEMREWAVEHEGDGVIGHEERVVDMITSAFLWVYAAGKEAAATPTTTAPDADATVASPSPSPDGRVVVNR